MGFSFIAVLSTSAAKSIIFCPIALGVKTRFFYQVVERGYLSEMPHPLEHPTSKDTISEQ